MFFAFIFDRRLQVALWKKAVNDLGYQNLEITLGSQMLNFEVGKLKPGYFSIQVDFTLVVTLFQSISLEPAQHFYINRL